MVVEQTVDIPVNRQLYINVPPEVPTGRTVLTFIPASVHKDIETAKAVWGNNQKNTKELKEKLDSLKGYLGKDSFGGMDGVAYQRNVRKEWNNYFEAIIGATAIVYDAQIVTRDEHFLECKYDKLKIWNNIPYI